MATDTPAVAAADRRLLLALVFAIGIFWGVNWPAMKIALGELSPWWFRTVTIAISASGLLWLARLSGERVRLATTDVRPMCAVSLFAITGWHLSTAFGLTMIESGRAVIVAFTMPVWAALVSTLWLGERHSWQVVVALLLGLCGLLVLLGPELGRLGERPLGALLVLLAAVSWAIGTVAIKARRWSVGVLALAGYQLLIGGVPIVLLTLWFEPVPDLSRLTWQGIVATAYGSTIALIFCYAAWVKIVTLVPATVAAMSTLLIPIVGLASSALLLGEPAGVRELSALALVLPALGLVLLPRGKAPTAAEV